ncbi:hypothetical protein LTS02_002788 [Friedmanniomyces endolithicus]|nr:hypothetical protein LTR94_003107 [Friedmanniomyces endolithicus]KAK0814732.1 hypothetical protein LTR38_002562 [Friedmanniomyces endolithicus]KAK0815007.1 hypothetical protein LTR75_004008 [Friedmanniomyces endolithicus]KAK0869742.1 hypothetical protein LTS02_002788 [Friedmanniomyces endolithicus]KAK0881969.1 hypothetical protein LTR87_004138 [Friedmanniomyces endolithicus]
MGASESKLTFKEDVFRLAREDNIPPDSPWWAQFYQLPESADDVFALWSPTDVRNLTANSASSLSSTQGLPQKNLETLIYTCVGRLHQLQHRRCYPDPHHPVAPEVLNCVRILTRLLPYIFETDQLHEWERRFFWEPRKPAQIWNKKHNRPGEYFDGLDPAKKFANDDNDLDVGQKEIGPPLGEQIIDLLVRYLFFAGFTLPKRLDSEGFPDLNVAYHIWNSGIGCRQSVGMTRENERNAVEVIRLLLSLFSRQLYLPPQIVAEIDVRSLSHMTTKPDRQVALSMICSLLNTVLKYNPASWRVPVELTAEGDSRARLANMSLDLLLVLLLYPDQGGEPNAYRKSLGRLHRVEDFQFIQQGLTTVLMQPISGASSFIPGQQKQVPWAPEMLILFWELLQVNKRFRSFIIETDRAHDFVVLVLFYAISAKDQPSKQGIVRMCVLILQTMSVEPAFGSRLNKPFVGHDSLPSVLRITNFHGSYADFLLTSIHTLMTTTQGRLESIYPALLAIVNNIAPNVRDLQRATSSKLLDLFISMSSPSFLLEKEPNHQLLMQLLQAMDAILEYQAAANRRFVEVVFRCRKRFSALRDFTLEGAMAELDRQSQQRKDRGEPGAASGVRSPVRNGSIDSVRNPASARSPQLGNVPEHDTFSIGDDEDDEGADADGMSSSTTFTAPLSASTSVVDDAVPLQSRSMSEKARGKQPVGQGSFSRTTARNTSTSSLPALITPQASAPHNTSQQFKPTPEWLETWLPHLPLHIILKTIENEHFRARDAAPMPTTTPQHADEVTASPRVQAFQWTSLSLGWYLGLLWGLVYSSDVAAHRGINGVWTGTGIKLFGVLAGPGQGISLRSPKGAVDYVGDAIALRIGSLSFGGSSPTTREV